MKREEFLAINKRFNQFFESFETLKRTQHLSSIDNNLTFIDVQTIVLIEEHRPINMVKLAKVQKVSRSAISQLVKRLIKKGLVELESLNGNDKNKFLKLTSKAKLVYEEHQYQQTYIESKLFNIFEKYSEKDIQTIMSLIDDIEAVWNHLPWSNKNWEGSDESNNRSY
ncbi:MarR family transcriptional regulator [Streptococcus agalactiae]|nr:transcriptional regulator [Streptococcus agalactiae 138P]AHX74718.1 transcriptional regulator [Streptococcus agalactiae]AKU01494.1 transcriptional regulator [Streptococcus agalactiae]AWQ29066.1 MarR family transcriptional regulator [Streptococcus agalactiae]OVF14878.1 MarR family transcriptional regulator [Streptococcus agalactiae]